MALQPLDGDHGEHSRNDMVDKINRYLLRLKALGKIKVNKGVRIPKAKLPDTFKALYIGPKGQPHFLHRNLLIVKSQTAPLKHSLSRAEKYNDIII